MIWLNLLLSPLVLAILYPLAVQYERGGNYRLLFPLYAIAGLYSTFVNYTWLTLIAMELPRKGEVTTSQRCERLVYLNTYVGSIARGIARYTNKFDPTGPHIPLPI